MAKIAPRIINICDVRETHALREKGAKESFEHFNNSRDTNVNIPVDEDHEDPDSRDSSISMNLTIWPLINLDFSGQSIQVSDWKLRPFNFRAVY